VSPAPAEPFGYTPGAATVPAQPVGPPISAVPETSAMPVLSGPPDQVSPGYGPAYGQAAFGQPGYGQPAYPPPGYPVPPRRGRAVPVLASLATVLLIAAGVLAALYVTKDSAYRKQVNTVKDRDTTISTQNSKIADLEGQLKTTQDKLKDETQKADGSQNQVTELTHEKQVISQCISLLGQVDAAVNKGDRATAQRLLTQSGPICDEAQRYLN
jgi:hypothetical protein